jgi:hypothetical protein
MSKKCLWQRTQCSLGGGVREEKKDVRVVRVDGEGGEEGEDGRRWARV